MKKSKNFSKKAIVAALAVSVGAAAQASTIDNVLNDPLFSLKELNNNAILVAHEEGKCGEGKCGADKKAGEAKCGEGKCGADKKAGEAKCGADKKAGEGTCGAKKN